MCENWINALIKKKIPIHKRPYGYMLILQGPYEQGIYSNTIFDLKILVVNHNMRTSYHKHRRSKTILLPLSGTAVLIVNDKEESLEPGDLKIIDRGVYHQIVNTSKQKFIVLESMYPPYNKDDIIYA